MNWTPFKSDFGLKFIFVILFLLFTSFPAIAETQPTEYSYAGQVQWYSKPGGGNVSSPVVFLIRKINGNVIDLRSQVGDDIGSFNFKNIPCPVPGETITMGVLVSNGTVYWWAPDSPYGTSQTDPNSPFYCFSGNYYYPNGIEYYGSIPPASANGLENQQNAGETCANQSVGEPVNVTNGNMWLQQTDYVLPGVGEPLQISRTYNTMTQGASFFGYGWSTNYDEKLITSNNDFIELRLSSGQAIYFLSAGNNTFAPATAGFYGQIAKNPDNTFTLTFKDGRVHQFLGNGKLFWQKDRTGNQTTLSYDSNGNLTSITSPTGRNLFVNVNSGRIVQLADSLGVVADYNYNPDGTLQSVNYPDGSKYQFEYTLINNRPYLTVVKDALNNILEAHQYDTQGRAVTSEKQGGVELYTLDYTHINDAVSYTTVTDALGRTAKYTFDKSKGRNVITRLEGNCACGSSSQSTDFVYDNSLNLIKTIDALGREVNNTYDNKGNLLTTTDAAGTEIYTYNNLGQVLTKTDRMNGVWTNIYDEFGNLTKSVDPSGGETYITYLPQNLHSLPYVINKVVNKKGSWHFWGRGWEYDTHGNVIAVEERNGKKTNYTYDARSRITSMTDALGSVTTFEYDAVNRPKKVINPNQKTIEYNYDAAGRRISTTNQRGFTTSYSYDGAGRLSAATDALNHTTTYGYDLMSNIVAQTDALGNVKNYQYDNFNRISKVVYPAAESGATRLEENYEYDQVGNLKKRIDSAGRQTQYNYDAVNRLVNTVDADQKVTQYEYNPRSQMTKVIDALNQVYEFSYDPLGRVLTQSRAGSTMSYTYDLIGNRLSRTDYKGVVTNYTYDVMNRLKTINYPNSAEDVNFTYDALNRLQKATNYAGTMDFNYTNLSQVAQVLDVHGRKINYRYDPAGNANKMFLDDVEQVDYSYDRANRLQTIKNSEDNTIVNYNYDDANRLIRKILPNGVTTAYQYDGMSRLTRLRDFKTNPDNSTTNLYNRQYSYNPASQISQIKIGNQTKDFAYDLVDRLTNVTASNAQQNENYSFDPVSNRTASHLSASYSYQPNNRLSNSQQATYVHDANGNTVTKTDLSGVTQFIWDYENRLRQVIKTDGSLINYKYDALGKRSERATLTSSTKFTYDGQDVILDVNSDGSFVKYFNGPGIDNKIRQTVNSQAQYFVQDHLGSTNALTDQNGTVISSATYDSFGNATGNIGTRYQYTGREKDDSIGLYYYRARWYDSNLGRFISEDPIGLDGGINQFGYVNGNPLNATDSLGLDAEYDEQLFRVQQEFIEALAPAIEFGEGFGDNVLFGLSKYVRPADDPNLQCSAAYQAGEWASIAIQIAEGGVGIYRGIGKLTLKKSLQTGAREIRELADHDWDLAEEVYKSIRQSSEDVAQVSHNSGMKEFQIRRIKDHLFYNKHQLDDGIARFDADPLIVNAWNRLKNGAHTSEDIGLMKHEYFESKFEALFKTDYRTAHNAALKSGRPGL